MDAATLDLLHALAARLGVTSSDKESMHMLLSSAYAKGRADGAMATAQLVASKTTTTTDSRSERLDRFAHDLARAKKAHPEVDFNKPVQLRGSFYKITGYNFRAPQNPFIITGPQGGIYKCKVDMIIRGQA